MKEFLTSSVLEKKWKHAVFSLMLFEVDVLMSFTDILPCAFCSWSCLNVPWIKEMIILSKGY